MNQAVNFFWTIICFMPVMAFWSHDNLIYCFVFIALGLLSLLLPPHLLQLSNNPKFYERIGVKFIRKFVQDGDWANRVARKTNPRRKIIKDKATAIKYASTIKMYDKYHSFCFVFFLLTAVYAITNGKTQMAVIIAVSNIIYNVCPILLQQYNRARLQKMVK